MPIILDPNKQGKSTGEDFDTQMKQRLESANFDYDYPRRLKLKPATEFHDKLLERVMRRARDSQRVMSRRYSHWRDIDKVLRTYVPPEDAEAKEGEKTKTKTAKTFIIPQTNATLEILLTYMVAAFIQDPIWKYEGIGPEDVIGAELMTHVVHQQAMRNRVGLSLHTQWRDSFAYGVGVTSPVWERRLGKRTVVRERGVMDTLRNLFLVSDRGRESEEDVLIYEGNKLVNIDPYSYLPDPDVSAHDVQSMEFAGWVEKTNYMAVLGRDKDSGDYIFNGRYVGLIDGRSSLVSYGTHAGGRREFSEHITSNNPVHVLWMYIDLIPSEWELGSGQYPEAWLFGVAGDRVLIAAQPLNLDHGMKPITVAAPDYDGYTANPISRLGTIHDIQNLIDFLYSSHIQNVRKAINDSIVLDPSIINYYDVATPEPGKLIRARRSAWGKNILKDSIFQLQVNDVTQGHVNDTMYLSDIMQHVSGATDIASGRMSPRTSRVSASEANQLSSSALSRLEKIARIISMQSMQPTGLMFAAHVQQLMEEETYIKSVGELEQRLREQYGVEADNGRIAVSPLDMVVKYDVLPHDGTIPGAEDAQTWIMLYQTIIQNPILAQQYDHLRIFQHIARQMGAKNVEAFINRQPPQPQVMEDDQVDQQVQQGNLVPTNGIQ
jgi:hypothetical protein